ncbi:4-hydroxy-tetrahydrodipicolinate reductase, partial [Striga asiatica]
MKLYRSNISTSGAKLNSFSNSNNQNQRGSIKIRAKSKASGFMAGRDDSTASGRGRSLSDYEDRPRDGTSAGGVEQIESRNGGEVRACNEWKMENNVNEYDE